MQTSSNFRGSRNSLAPPSLHTSRRITERNDWNAVGEPRFLLIKPSLLRQGSLAERNLRTGRELTGPRTPALGGNQKGLTLLPPLSLLPSLARRRPANQLLRVQENAGDPTEKGQRKRGKRKRGRGGPRAKPGPDRQQAAPVVNTRRPVEVPRGNGNHRIPNPDIRPNLSLPREQRKAEVDRRLAASNPPRPTRWDSLPEPSPRRSPPCRNDRRSPPRPTLDNQKRQRTSSPVDRRALPDDTKLLGFVAGALELIKERVLRV